MLTLFSCVGEKNKVVSIDHSFKSKNCFPPSLNFPRITNLIKEKEKLHQGGGMEGPPIKVEDEQPVRKKIWLDCDPGHDDAMAIILAGHNPHIHLLGISTVAGNQTVEKTTINALRILAAADIPNIDVVMGQAKPLMRPGRACPEIHGDCGLGTKSGSQFPIIPTRPRLQKKAIVHMYDVISQEADGSVTLVATAALTNVALLLTVYPEISVKLKEIVIMGGSLGLGNTGPVQEFNIQCDPEAAKIVFESGLHLVMVPIQVTHTCVVTEEVIEGLERSLQSPFGKLMIDLLHFFATTYRDVFSFLHPPLHDPLTIAYVINPSIFKTKFYRVDIETGSELSAGQTVVDVWGQSAKPKNVWVAEQVDVPAFWKMMHDAWTAANRTSPLNIISKSVPN
jgi:inosine-uridine nucleoside N-ribohydrolase